jgi:hypothetical protein
MKLAAQAIATVSVVVIVLCAALTVGLATGLVHVYGVGNGALNSGVVVGTDGHNVGFEWAGAVGPFVDAS